jgi:hypothetical protein
MTNYKLTARLFSLSKLHIVMPRTTKTIHHWSYKYKVVDSRWRMQRLFKWISKMLFQRCKFSRFFHKKTKNQPNLNDLANLAQTNKKISNSIANPRKKTSISKTLVLKQINSQRSSKIIHKPQVRNFVYLRIRFQKILSSSKASTKMHVSCWVKVRLILSLSISK